MYKRQSLDVVAQLQVLLVSGPVSQGLVANERHVRDKDGFRAGHVNPPVGV